MENGFRSGFVGIAGPTNSGKSTLLNALMGKKLSIVSHRSQTTYHGIRGIRNSPDSQAIYVDTPGYQKHRERLARLLNKVADKSIKECDILLWVFDASSPKAMGELEALEERIRNRPQEKNFCVLNKVDKIPKLRLLPLMEQIHAKGIFSQIIPVSALKGDGVDRIAGAVVPILPEGVPWFSPEQVTDRPQAFVLTEFIREKIYHATRQEIPYTVRVELEEWESPEPTKKPVFHAVLLVDSESRRGILIGKGADRLKAIGIGARKEIEAYLGYEICLKLHVRVDAGWRDDDRRVKRYLELE